VRTTTSRASKSTSSDVSASSSARRRPSEAASSKHWPGLLARSGEQAIYFLVHGDEDRPRCLAGTLASIGERGRVVGELPVHDEVIEDATKDAGYVRDCVRTLPRRGEARADVLHIGRPQGAT
jgi:hypothetical protein